MSIKIEYDDSVQGFDIGSNFDAMMGGILGRPIRASKIHLPNRCPTSFELSSRFHFAGQSISQKHGLRY